jgi:hypothetical protein
MVRLPAAAGMFLFATSVHVTQPHIQRVTQPHIQRATQPHIQRVTQPHIQQATQPHIQRVPGALSPGVKLSGCEADH